MSRPFDISGSMERAHPEPQGLEEDDDDGDDNDEFGYVCHLTHLPPPCKSLGDSHLEEPDEPDPAQGHSCMVKEDGEENRTYAKRLARHTLELEEDTQEFQEPFYKDMEMSGSLSEEEEDSSWTRTYHLPVHQRTRVPRAASASLGDPCDSIQHGMGRHLGTDAFAPWAHASDPHLAYPDLARGAEPCAQHEEAIGDREFPSLHLTYKVLWDENRMLRRMVRSMQGSLESQALTTRSLERQLKASLVKEERRAQGLQAIIQQTERSLQLMTQRALEAENRAESLKQELLLLQGELEASKVENESLRLGQTTDLGAVKNNIDFALKNLHKIIAGANWSIKQLVSGTESLNFVAELLKSTGKISDAEAEEEL